MDSKDITTSPQKFSTLSLNDVPDEVILRVFSNLEFKDFIRCGQVSKRIRAISQDQSLWLRINLFENKSVATGFLEYVLNNGCKYLGLGFTQIGQIDGESLKCNSSQLKCLDLSFCQSSRQVFDDLLSSCHSLEGCYSFGLTLGRSFWLICSYLLSFVITGGSLIGYSFYLGA